NHFIRLSIHSSFLFSASTLLFFSFFLPDTPPTELLPLSLHDALPICLPHPICSGGSIAGFRSASPPSLPAVRLRPRGATGLLAKIGRAHVELQSRGHLVCRLLLEKKKKKQNLPRHTA